MTDATRTTRTPAVLSARRRWWASARTSFFWIVLIAFGVRFGYIVIGHTYKSRSDKKTFAAPANEKHFDFGFEMGRIGRSLAEGNGFGNPKRGDGKRLGPKAARVFALPALDFEPKSAE